MALHILNCSVDAPDFSPEDVPEDLSYNDMESVAEIILEKFFDFENAIIEQEENDSDQGSGLNIKKGSDFFLFHNLITFRAIHIAVKTFEPVTYKDQYSGQFHPEITPPPPKGILFI